MHDIHKIAVDAAFTKMKSKKGINRHGKISIADMYNLYK